MTPEPEENRLDQSLRDKFTDFDLSPTAGLWTGIEQQLGNLPPPVLPQRRRRWPVPLLLVLTAFVAGLLGWLLPHGEPASVAGSATVVEHSPKPLAKPGHQSAGLSTNARITERNINQHRAAILAIALRLKLVEKQPSKPSTATNSNDGANRQSRVLSRLNMPALRAVALAATAANEAEPSPNASNPAATFTLENSATSATATEAARTTTATVVAAQQPTETVPATLRALAALERETLEQLPSISTLNPGPPPAAGRTALVANLRTERAELFRLQRRTDSLLLALGDLPAAPRVAPALATAPAADTARPRPLAHRWSLLLTATPEQNTLALQGPEGDSLTALRRNHETGRAGFSAALTAEYKLTPRLHVGGGVGYSTYGADVRITNKTTDVRVTYNTATTHTTNVFTSTNHTYSIRVVQVPQLSPIFNGSGQVIRYDTVYVPRQDTVFTTIVQHDTVRTTRQTTTPLITKKETITTKLLQPNYRFFTVPVLLRYRLTPGNGRLWTDVAFGAQLQFFLGGTQVVTNDGENFRTETIRAGDGPFRALNVALSGSLALNYALTNRLSVSVAPSLRWQALSLYKPETGLIQQPTATGLMFGVRFGL